MAYTPKRRGRRPSVKTAGPDGDTITPPVLTPPAETAQEAAPEPARRRKRADIGGQHLKLKVPEREGYMRRWVNDVPGRIAMFHDLAYDHVTDPAIKSDSPDSRIRRQVGTTVGGAPQYAYLMETPLEEYQAGVAEKEEGRAAFEAAIKRGEDTLGSSILSKTQSHESFIR